MTSETAAHADMIASAVKAAAAEAGLRPDCIGDATWRALARFPADANGLHAWLESKAGLRGDAPYLFAPPPLPDQSPRKLSARAKLDIANGVPAPNMGSGK